MIMSELTEIKSISESNERMAFDAKHVLAVVAGKDVTEVPKDLYIPPDALHIFLETFQGPLDLLLYLIKRQNLDILNIPIAKITDQYMEYVMLMKDLQLELAAEYLVMAAMLAEIKSKLLLPRPPRDEAGEEIDPRAELIRRLQDYERFKQAAEDIDELPRYERDLFAVKAKLPEIKQAVVIPSVSLDDMLNAFKVVLKRARLTASHYIAREPLSIRERMSTILERINQCEFIEFSALFTIEEGRSGVVVTFIGILELLRQSMIDIVQGEDSTVIHIKAVSR